MTEVISDNNTSQTDDLSDAAQLTIGEPCQSEEAYKEIGKKASAVTGKASTRKIGCCIMNKRSKGYYVELFTGI